MSSEVFWRDGQTVDAAVAALTLPQHSAPSQTLGWLALPDVQLALQVRLRSAFQDHFKPASGT